MEEYMSPNRPYYYDDYFSDDEEEDNESEPDMTIEHLLIQAYIQFVESQTVESKRISTLGEMLEYLMTIPDTLAASPPFRTEFIGMVAVLKTLPTAYPIWDIIVRTETFLDSLKSNPNYAQ